MKKCGICGAEVELIAFHWKKNHPQEYAKTLKMAGLGP